MASNSSSTSVRTSEDGRVTIITSDDGQAVATTGAAPPPPAPPLRPDHGVTDAVGFLAGMLILFGAIAAMVIHGSRLRHRERMAALQAPAAPGEEVARLTARVERAEQRLAVLERLATDPSVPLAHEIDSLRVSAPASREMR